VRLSANLHFHKVAPEPKQLPTPGLGLYNYMEMLSAPYWKAPACEESSDIVRFVNLLSPSGLPDALQLGFHSQTNQVALWNRLG
jgi:hypothetical protein